MKHELVDSIVKKRDSQLEKPVFKERFFNCRVSQSVLEIYTAKNAV
jgi:hypothetical protein